MKKKLIATIGAMVVAGMIGFAFTQSGVVNAGPKLSQQEIKAQVLGQFPGEITELEMETEGEKVVYEVEIELDDKEYELKIDGDTGDTLKLEEKVIAQASTSTADDDQNEKQTESKTTESNDDQSSRVSSNTTVNQNNDDADDKIENNRNDDNADDKTEKSNNSDDADDKITVSVETQLLSGINALTESIIDKAEAKRIALSEFSGNIVEFELDEDDNRLVYEIEIVNGDMDAEIEIDANTGAILELEIETNDDDDDEHNDDMD